MYDIPQTFPTKLVDRCLAAVDGVFTPIIQLEMEFDFFLEERRLARAVDLVLDAVPILGCRFDPRKIRPRWERVGPEARSVFRFTRLEGDYEAFKRSSIDFFSEPQIAACLWRGASTDRLILKVSHLVADAAAVRDICAMLSSIYKRLDEDPDFRPEPDLADARSFWQALWQVPWYALPRIVYNYFREIIASMMPRKSHAVSIEPASSSANRFVIRHIDRETVAQMVRVGRKHNATINDMLLTAIFRALSKTGEQDAAAALRIAMTIDLRRYMPSGRAKSIANFSAIEYITYGTAVEDDFQATLIRVSKMVNRRKCAWLGLSACVSTNLSVWGMPFAILEIFLKKACKSMYRKGHSPDLFTNMGAIPPQTVDFGGHPARAWMLPPGCDLPMFLFGCSGYDGSLSLSAAVAPDSENRALAERFFESILAELTAAGNSS